MLEKTSEILRWRYCIMSWNDWMSLSGPTCIEGDLCKLALLQITCVVLTFMFLRFTQICRSLLEAGISAGDFASFFLSRLALLAVDEVVNVRIGTARTIRQVYLNEAYRQELQNLVTGDDMENDSEASSTQSSTLLDQMIYRLALDRDQDVRLFVLDLVDPEKLQQEEKALVTLVAEQQHSKGGSELQQQRSGAPMQCTEDSTFTTTHHLSSINNDPSPNGHTIMRKILAADEQHIDNARDPEPETNQHQPQHYREERHENEQHHNQHHHNQTQHIQFQPHQLSQEHIRTVDATNGDHGIIKDTTSSTAPAVGTNDDSLPLNDVNGIVNTSSTNSPRSHFGNDSPSPTAPLNDEGAVDTAMDYTEETHHDHGKKSTHHDEDGDELMTDAERDDDDEEPAMIDDEDESTFAADEKEKGEYIYLSKSSSKLVLAGGSSSLIGGDTT